MNTSDRSVTVATMFVPTTKERKVKMIKVRVRVSPI